MKTRSFLTSFLAERRFTRGKKYHAWSRKLVAEYARKLNRELRRAASRELAEMSEVDMFDDSENIEWEIFFDYEDPCHWHWMKWHHDGLTQDDLLAHNLAETTSFRQSPAAVRTFSDDLLEIEDLRYEQQRDDTSYVYPDRELTRLVGKELRITRWEVAQQVETADVAEDYGSDKQRAYVVELTRPMKPGVGCDRF